MDDGLLFLMTDLWPFIGTISSSMGIFYFIFMVDPSTLTIVLTQFRKNIKKDQNTHVILHVLVFRHTGESISLNGKVPFMNIPKKLIFLRNRVGF